MEIFLDEIHALVFNCQYFFFFSQKWENYLIQTEVQGDQVQNIPFPLHFFLRFSIHLYVAVSQSSVPTFLLYSLNKCQWIDHLWFQLPFFITTPTSLPQAHWFLPSFQTLPAFPQDSQNKFLAESINFLFKPLFVVLS